MKRFLIDLGQFLCVVALVVVAFLAGQQHGTQTAQTGGFNKHNTVKLETAKPGDLNFIVRQG